MPQKIIILCDFDGTITFQDSLLPIYEGFASCGTHFAELWDLGEVGTREEMIGTFKCIHASREEMEPALDQLTIDQDLHKVMAYCQDLDLEFAILSDGLEWYVRYILGRYGFSDVTTYANQIEFLADGTFHFEFPWFNPVNPKRGLYKPDIVEKYHQAGYHTIFIGNGGSDQDAVWKAERIYAKNPLFDYCQKNDIAAQHFETFAELLKLWQKNPPHMDWRGS